MKLQTALESANSFGAILKIADRVQPQITFLGSEYLSSPRYAGTITMEDLLCRINTLVDRIQNRNKGGFLLASLSKKENEHAIALKNRVNFLLKEETTLALSDIITCWILLVKTASFSIYKLCTWQSLEDHHSRWDRYTRVNLGGFPNHN